MRKIIFAINMTIDGYFDHTAIIADDELHEKAAELFRSADVVLFGRKMYQLMSEYWPSAPLDKTLSASVLDFADAINQIEKIVFSKTLKNVSWKTRLFREVDADEIRAMKSLPGRDILLGGGAELAQSFLDLDLIDEYRFIVHPVILGGGTRLFSKIARRKDLQLTHQNKRKSGAVELVYIPRDLRT